jgi:CRISPR/Cas system CSM-associated protein Csm4 (group 5 of RAMP superfamily)
MGILMMMTENSIFKKIDLIADQVISGERTNGFGFQ